SVYGRNHQAQPFAARLQYAGTRVRLCLAPQQRVQLRELDARPPVPGHARYAALSRPAPELPSWRTQRPRETVPGPDDLWRDDLQDRGRDRRRAWLQASG